MTTRLKDPPEVKPTRTVPFWTVLGIFMPLLLVIAGQALLTWKGQGEQAIRGTHTIERLAELTAEVKALRLQSEQKSSKDAEQDARLLDYDRRLTRLESH